MSISTSATSELFIPSHELKITTNTPDFTNNFASIAPNSQLKTIPLKVLPTAVPQVITTTKTLRRCCGFSLALIGLIFYCLRALLALWWIACFFCFGTSMDSVEIVLEAMACSIGITKFLTVMKYPKLTLKESNFKVKNI